jgi:hypothetical protein
MRKDDNMTNKKPSIVKYLTKKFIDALKYNLANDKENIIYYDQMSLYASLRKQEIMESHNLKDITKTNFNAISNEVDITHIDSFHSPILDFDFATYYPTFITVPNFALIKHIKRINNRQKLFNNLKKLGRKV